MLLDLNECQYSAATSDNRTILCLAGAGCGKTKTLLSRIEYLQTTKHVDPTSMLCLTFTNAAAFEMKERYKKSNVDLSNGCPEFRTFHGFCYSLIVKDKSVRDRMGYTAVPSLCDDAQMKEIKTQVKLKLNCKLTDAQLDNDVPLTRQQQDQKQLFQKALVKELRQSNVITFDIMCYNVCDLFVKGEECVNKYKKQYKYLFIDETQDSDPRQFKFIGSFPETTNFFLVGDILQNIYQFRNCSNKFIKQLTKDPNWEVIKLNKNYRSTRSICEYANKFSKYSQDDFRIEMEGQRDGDPVETIYGSFSSYDNPVDAEHLRILIEKLKQSKGESAILCRTNKECAAVRAALTEEGIQYTSRIKSSDVVNYLESALSNDYLLDWISSKLDTKDYGDYIRLSSLTSTYDIKWFLSNWGSRDKINECVSKVVNIRNIMSSQESDFKSKFDQVTKLLRVKTKCKFDDSINSNRGLIEYIRDQLQELEDSQIYCGTIHSSKGLEYDTVYVMGVDDKMFELGTEEMNNLFYVAMTRARDHLVIFRR